MKNIIVVGTGAAGLSATLEIARLGGTVTLITKKVYRNSVYKWKSDGGCSWKTHAFNAAIGKDDSIQQHIKDTIEGGVYANHPQLVQTLCEKSVGLVDWLISLNINIERDANDILAAKPFGGCDIPRAVFIEDRLGFYIQKALLERIDILIDSGVVKLYEGLRFTKIIKDDNGVAIGITAIDNETLEYISFWGDSIIIADGGGTSMYSTTAASRDKTCDGIVAAFFAGAEIIDMEFVQFHPTGLFSSNPVFDGSLFEESVRFMGGELYNVKNKQFMYNYHPLGELATRDIVSRGIISEINKGQGFDKSYVIMNISKCYKRILQEYPALSERLLQAGFDINIEHQIPVRPTAHFLMGGIRINNRAETSINNLFAAGESCGGVHGANRLGGNGLSEAMVMGRLAAENSLLAITPTSLTKAKKFSFLRDDEQNNLKRIGKFDGESLIEDLRYNMSKYCGPIKSKQSINRMRELIAKYKDMFKNIYITSGSRGTDQARVMLDIKNLLLASELIVEFSHRREESRGSHYRADFPQTNQKYVPLKLHYDAKSWIWENYELKN